MVMERRTPEPLWTPTDVPAYLSVPVQTLYQWRLKRTGPPCRRVGRPCATSRTPSAPGSPSSATTASPEPPGISQPARVHRS
jgi:hypothetical protein